MKFCRALSKDNSVTPSLEESIRLIESGSLDAIQQGIAMCEALQEDPTQRPDALHIMGVAVAYTGDTERALSCMAEAVKADPDNLERRLNYGNLALELGSNDVAVKELSVFSEMAPDDAIGHTMHGNALERVGAYEEAVMAHEKALALLPNVAELWSNLASTYLAWGKLEAAEAGYDYAVKLSPTKATLHFNLAGARVRLGRIEPGLEALNQAIHLNPAYGSALSSRGVVLRSLGQLSEGLLDLEKAFTVAPEDPEVRWNLAHGYLYDGRYSEGWDLYEVRRQRQPQLGREGFGVAWDGSENPAQTVVIEREQGLGDSLQFLRYLPEASERVGEVIFRAQESLVPLLKEACTFDEIRFEPFQLEPYPGLYAPLMSLPFLLRSGNDKRPSVYITPLKSRVEAWKEKLGPKTKGPRIGLVWQGNPQYPNDHLRSIALTSFAPLLSLAGIEVISLQKRFGEEQIESMPAHLRPRTLEGLDEEGAFLDTSAVMANLDLVVTSDTAALHLAGAMGVETFALLPKVADWRWGQGTQSWYPSVRGFSQTQAGDWDKVIGEMVSEISNRFGG